MVAEMEKRPANWPRRERRDKLWKHVVNINEVVKLIRDTDLAFYCVRLT